MNNKEVSSSYEGPLDPPDQFEALLRNAQIIDISIGVHRPDLRGSEAVQNMVSIAYNMGMSHAVCPMRCCEGLPGREEVEELNASMNPENYAN